MDTDVTHDDRLKTKTLTQLQTLHGKKLSGRSEGNSAKETVREKPSKGQESFLIGREE